MVGPIRVDGLFSGLDTTSIVEQLLSVQRRPIIRFERRIQENELKKASFLQLNANLLAFKGVADNLSRPSFFNQTQVSSSNESVIRATGGSVTSLGSFTFSARQLATTHQVISSGFADQDTTAVSTSDSVFTLELGGGYLERDTLLSSLNGGQGVDRGRIQITDSSGSTAVVDLEGAVSVTDVLTAINEETGISVQARVAGDRIVVQDLAGGLPAAFSISNFGSDSTASDLGIAGTGTAGPGGNFIYGSGINIATTATSHLMLNDGLGIRRNTDGVMDFSITGPDGVAFSVDIQNADDTVGDMISRIDSAASAAGSSVTATLTPDGTALQLTGTGDLGFTVTPLGGSFAAVDLGFGVVDGSTFTQVSAENEANGLASGLGDVSQRLVGRRILGSINSTLRSLLNGGQTHDTTPANVTAGAAIGATTISVDSIDGLTVGDRIRIFEGGVTQVRRITDVAGSALTLDQGLTSAITVAADVSDLQGVADGSVTVTDRQGDAFTIDLSSRISTTTTAAALAGATSLTLSSVDGFSVGNKIRVVSGGVVQQRTITDITGSTVSFDQALSSGVGLGDGVLTDHDSLTAILNTLNERGTAAGVDVRFEFDSESNGLQAVDTSGGGGSLSIADASGTVAADLGLAASVGGNAIDGEDLDVQYLSPFTALAGLNGGKGVQAGSIRIIDTNGTEINVDLSQANDTTLGAVLIDLNGAAAAAGSGVTARINNTGDGLILTDSTPGAGTLRVEESGATRTAADLGLLGSASSGNPTQINGSFEKRVEIDAGSTLQDVRNALNAAGVPITASIVNDGNPTNPFRLTVFSNVTGKAGRLVLDSDVSGVSFETTSKAKDSVLLFGTPGSDPLMLTSADNRYTNVVPGLTLDLLSTSNAPVTVAVSRDSSAVVQQGTEFAEKYNAVVQLINELTFFNVDSLDKGPLFGDSTIRRIKQDLTQLVTGIVTDIPQGSLRTLQEVGFRLSGEGGLSFDASIFSEAVETKFDEVVDLFTRQRRLKIDTPVADLNSGLGINPVAGDDVRIRARDGLTDFLVNFSGAGSLGGILSAINNAPGNGGAITASISADGFSLLLSDNTSVPNRDVDGVTSPTMFTETAFIGEPDDQLNGATVTFLTGANAGQIRTVSDFVGATGEITLDSALPAALGIGDTYRIERPIQVEPQNSSPAGNELKLVGQALLGQTSYKSGLINLSNDPGVGFRFSERLDFMTRPDNGFISTRTDSLDDSIESLNDQIEKVEERLVRLEERLVREFTNLEIIIAQSQSTMARLQSSLSAITGLSGGGGLGG